MLFRILLNAVILLVLWRLIRPLANRIARAGRGREQSGKARTHTGGRGPYEHLTPYDIEDADYVDLDKKNDDKK